jgi:hypothetical protein
MATWGRGSRPSVVYVAWSLRGAHGRLSQRILVGDQSGVLRPGPGTRIASGTELRLLASPVLAKLPRTVWHDGYAAGATQREWSMQQASENGARPGMGRALGSIAAAVLFTAALCQPNLGHADGGWHGGFAGLPHSFGGGHSCDRFDSWRNGRDGWWRVPGWDGLPIHIRSGVTILTTATTTTASFTHPSIGITAPIRQAITPT